MKKIGICIIDNKNNKNVENTSAIDCQVFLSIYLLVGYNKSTTELLLLNC
jgi:hypothetical protein